MPKKISISGIITVLIVMVIALVACSTASTTPSPTASPTITAVPTVTTSPATATATATATAKPTASATATVAPTATPTPMATATQTSGGTLSDVLGLASSIPTMKYDMVTTTTGNIVTTATMWVKKSKMRMESTQQGQNVIMLVDGDAKTMYMYMPAQNMAIKMDYSQSPQSASDSSGSATKYNPVILGSETIDGKVCRVIQFTADGAVTKEWVWEAKGLPVRIQVTTAQGASTTDFKNYDFSDIPDSMFVLPAGVSIQSLNIPTK